MRVALVAVVVAVSAMAHANPAAEKIYRDGKDLLAKGKTDEACEAFRRSNELEARVGTLLNLADCEEKRGRFATAWVAWVDARGLATRLGDARATLADQRAAALAPKLSYLTLSIAPTGLAAGLIVRRNGADVPRAELGVEIPLDPGRFALEALAPGFSPWTKSIDLTPGQRVAIEIPMLVPDGSSTTTTAPTSASTSINGTSPPMPPPTGIATHRFGVGAALGMMTEGSVIYGVRIPVHLIEAGPGTIRAVPSFFFSPKLDDEDPSRQQSLYGIGFGLEYVHPVARQFVVAAGLVGGLELLDDSYGSGSLSRHAWIAVRVSPTLRLAHSLDLAFHLQLGGGDRHPVSSAEGAGGTIVGLGVVGVDYFFW
ncbi:MAG: hypothetical protein ACKV2T_22255 [Kofleriaceae bacterium]